LATISFQVEPASISGLWDSDLNLGPQIKKNPVRFIEDGDDIKWGGVYAEDTDKWIRFADETPNPKTGRREGNIIYTTSGGGCGTGPGGRKAGEIRNDIPAKLIISEDGKKMTLQSKKYKCRTDGTMIVTEEWETLWTYTKRP
jgi:hypothetical protein